MAKKRRLQPSTNPINMSNDQSTDVAVDTAEPTEPSAADAPPVSVVTTEEAPVKRLAIPKEVLRGVFNKRTVDAVSDELWESAVAAVEAGDVVTLSARAPFINVTKVKFEPAKLPPGISHEVSVLNNLISGML